MSFSDFFLCHAPHAKYPPQVVTQIYHDGSPRFFGSLVLVDFTGIKRLSVNFGGVNMPFIYHHPEEGSRFYILVLDKRSRQYSSNLEEMLIKTALWYSTYLHQSGRVKSKLIEWEIFQPFNERTPGLRIIELAGHDTWMLSFPEGVKTFDTQTEMDEYMEKVLGYSEDQLTSGYVNSVGTRAFI